MNDRSSMTWRVRILLLTTIFSLVVLGCDSGEPPQGVFRAGFGDPVES